MTIRELSQWSWGVAVPGWISAAEYEGHVVRSSIAAAERARELVAAEMLEAADVLEGHPADALRGASEDLDLLVCGSRGYGPLHAVLLGGVSRALVGGAACPVLVLPRMGGATFGRLVRPGTERAEV